MSISKSSFLNNYKNKVVSKDDSEKINEAIRYAFKLTDLYGIERINKSILEASVEFKIDEMDKQIKIETGVEPDDATINPDLLDYQGD